MSNGGWVQPGWVQPGWVQSPGTGGGIRTAGIAVLPSAKVARSRVVAEVRFDSSVVTKASLDSSERPEVSLSSTIRPL